MNNEQLTQEVNRLANEIEILKSFISNTFESSVKEFLFAPSATPSGYLQTLNLTGNSQSIQVPASPDQWVQLKTNIWIIRIGGYKS